MKKKICKLSTIVCVSLFLLGLTITARASDTSQTLVAEGRALFFKNGNPTYSGLLAANEKFKAAVTEDSSDQEANLFCAVTRIMAFGLEQGSSPELETLRELFEVFGISRNNVDLVETGAPFNDPPEIYDHYDPPEPIPGGEGVRAFLAGPFLTLLDAAITNLNVITDTFNITLLASEVDDDRDVEVDYGDVLLFRSALYTLKSVILIVTAYDLDIDIRELLVLGNANVLQIQRDILDKYSDFLNLRPADGAGSLTNAKQALLNGIEAYSEAFTFITGTSDDRINELFYFDSGQDQRKAEFVLTQLTELKNSLNENRPAKFTTIDETWIFTDTTTNDQLEVEIEKDVNKKFVIGDYWGRNGCDFISCSGWVESFSISATSVTIEVAYDGMYSGSATFTSTINAEGTSISSGIYTEYDDFGIVKGSGFFTATRQSHEEETETIDFNCIFGNTDPANKKFPLDIRKILPEFDQYDEPVQDSFKEPILNGILPDFITNDALTEELELMGGLMEISIVENSSINVDGLVNDWTSASSFFTDQIGEESAIMAGSDIKDIYLAKDDNYLYFRIDLANGAPNKTWVDNEYIRYQFNFEVENSYNTQKQISIWWENDQWNVSTMYESNEGYVNDLSPDAFVQDNGNILEGRVSLTFIGIMSGRYIRANICSQKRTAYYDYITNRLDFAESPMIGPLFSISGNVICDAHDGSGNIYIYALDGPDLYTAHELGSTFISASGDYNMDFIPAGENVYLFARWDTDDNGTETPGDYLYKTGPITVTGNGAITTNFESSTIIAGSKGEPYFIFCNVQAFNSSEGVMMALTAKVFDPDGTVPDTINSITVSGPSEFSYSFAAEDYSGRNAYWYETSAHPSVGEYTFTVTDSDGKTAVSHYYFHGVSNIPVPNTSTFQASGDSLTPTLSWRAVSGYEGNLFYRAGIFEVDGENLIPVWRSSYFTTNTVMEVPDGILDGTKSYEWRVGAFDNYIYTVSNNRSVSNIVDLTVDNTMPYFTTATVYNCQDSDGQFYTALKAMVVDPDGTIPGSIQSLTVKNPNGSTIYTFQSEDYDSILQKYYKKISGRPVDGIYEFTLTDINNNTKTTYDYVEVHDVPLIDANTLQASGDTLTPTLSWGAPTGMDRSLYFRAMVYDNDGNQIWKPEWTANTYLDVPSGILQEGISYLWNVQVFDDKYSVNYSNRSNSNKVDLVIDNTRPYFKWATIYKRHTTDGIYTALDAAVVDPNGTVPDSIQSLTVTGPDGFSQNLLSVDYYPFDNNFFLTVPGTPAEGIYTFTVTDNEGNKSVTHDYVKVSADIPLVDETSISITGNVLSPTISWSSISGYQGHLFYRIWVYDDQFNTVYVSKREPFTAQKIPAGKLEWGKSYFIRVDAHDHRDWVIYNSRSNSSQVIWTPLGEVVTSVSGNVSDLDGNPIPNVFISAESDGYSDNWYWADTNTDAEGNYTLNGLRDGNVYVRACATCSGLNYIDEWYDGVSNYDDRTLVSVITGQNTPGIDFSLWFSSSISGYVYEENGETPIYNVYVYATDYNTGEQVGGTNTNQDGSYILALPTGTYRAKACASCSDLNYIDEYYNNTDAWEQAAEISVTSPCEISGIDFTLTIPHKKGDLNNDNNVNLSDAILALKVVARLSPTEINLNADVNDDGKIGLSEVVYILQYVAGLR